MLFLWLSLLSQMVSLISSWFSSLKPKPQAKAKEKQKEADSKKEKNPYKLRIV